MNKQKRKLCCCHNHASLSVAIMSMLICDSVPHVYICRYVCLGYRVCYIHTYVISLSLWCLQNFKMQKFEKNSYARLPTCLIHLVNIGPTNKEPD